MAKAARGRYSHDFGLGAVGSWGRHLQALDVLEVNPCHGLQALTAQLIDRRRYGRRHWVSLDCGWLRPPKVPPPLIAVARPTCRLAAGGQQQQGCTEKRAGG